jgi:hypothetical protein
MDINKVAMIILMGTGIEDIHHRIFSYTTKSNRALMMLPKSP